MLILKRESNLKNGWMEIYKGWRNVLMGVIMNLITSWNNKELVQVFHSRRSVQISNQAADCCRNFACGKGGSLQDPCWTARLFLLLQPNKNESNNCWPYFIVDMKVFNLEKSDIEFVTKLFLIKRLVVFLFNRNYSSYVLL